MDYTSNIYQSKLYFANKKERKSNRQHAAIQRFKVVKNVKQSNWNCKNRQFIRPHSITRFIQRSGAHKYAILFIHSQTEKKIVEYEMFFKKTYKSTFLFYFALLWSCFSSCQRVYVCGTWEINVIYSLPLSHASKNPFIFARRKIRRLKKWMTQVFFFAFFYCVFITENNDDTFIIYKLKPLNLEVFELFFSHHLNY